MGSQTLLCAQVSPKIQIIGYGRKTILNLGKPEGGGHSCDGDSGAPLFRTEFDDTGKIRTVLVGTNHGAPDPCGSFPTIFARVEDPSILNYIKGPRGALCEIICRSISQ